MASGRSLRALVSRRFDSMGVVSGDVVYVICWTRGMLRVISSLVADRILRRVGGSRKRYGGGRWSGFDDLEGEPAHGRLIHFDVIVPEEEIGGRVRNGGWGSRSQTQSSRRCRPADVPRRETDHRSDGDHVRRIAGRVAPCRNQVLVEGRRVQSRRSRRSRVAEGRRRVDVRSARTDPSVVSNQPGASAYRGQPRVQDTLTRRWGGVAKGSPASRVTCRFTSDGESLDSPRRQFLSRPRLLRSMMTAISRRERSYRRPRARRHVERG